MCIIKEGRMGSLRVATVSPSEETTAEAVVVPKMKNAGRTCEHPSYRKNISGDTSISRSFDKSHDRFIKRPERMLTTENAEIA
jgi:hypothetical protein